MAFDVDLSGWAVSDGIDYAIPDGTVISAGGYLVISPPWRGALANGGERLRLHNNSGRIMDEVEYGDRGAWPDGPDGSGATLAKIDPGTASAPPENWQTSREVGGTPGLPNFPSPGEGATHDVILVPVDAPWRYDQSGAGLAAGWASAAHPAWPQGPGLLGFETTPDALPHPIGTEFANPTQNAIVTYYLEIEFDLGAAGLDNLSALTMRHVIDDGAIFYLNGTEVEPRFNMPEGAVDAATLASGGVGNAGWEGPFDLPAAILVAGTNRLSVEVHQQSPTSSDIIFGAEITGTFAQPVAAGHPLRLSEFSGTSDPDFFLEITNTGTETIDAAGFVVASVGMMSGDYVLPSPSPVPPGGYLVVSGDALGFRPAAADRLFLYNPDKSVLIDAARAGDLPRARSPDHGGQLLVPDVPTFGSPNTFALRDDIVINEIMYHFRDDPGSAGTPAETGSLELIPIGATWRYGESGADAGFGWASTAHVQWPSGPALLGSETTPDALPEPLRTEFAPSGANDIITYYFEREFALQADQLASLASLSLRHIIDDGAVFYLNGTEVYRLNMPDGPVGAATLANQGVPNASYGGPVDLPVGSLVPGTNRISVEVHQQFANSSDIVFGAELTAVTQLAPGTAPHPVVERDEEWLELFNRGGAPVDLSGWALAGGIRFDFPPGSTIPAGGYLVVAKDSVELAGKYPGLGGIIVGNFGGRLGNAGDDIRLLDALTNPVDEIRYYEGGRWPGLADGGGSSLELRDPHADNAIGTAWAASDESGKSEWETIRYRGDGGQSYGLTHWNEFRLGMLQGGKVLIDDVSVVRDPDGARQELIQNGSFSGGTDKWRLLGNHRHSAAIPEPGNPGNMVLLLDARGRTDTRHNHLETTLVGNTPIQVGQTYEVSFRARWVSGSNLLNSRCYYQRLARTTRIARPESCGTPGAPNSRAEPNIGPTFSMLRHDPPIPTAGQAITVRAEVADPDGLGEISLMTRVNEGPVATAAFTVSADGRGSAVIPGQPAGAVIQFWIEADDALGATSMEPPGGPDSRALIQVDDGQGTGLAAPEIRIVMLPSDRTFLLEPLNLMSNERVGCTLVYRRSEVTYDSRVRLRGSGAGRARDGDAFRGFNVAVPADRLFRGVHQTLSIDRSARTPVTRQQHEIYVKHMFNHAGVPCMYDELIYLVGPAPVYTGTSQMIMAGYGTDFTESQFPDDGQGTVFNLDITYDPSTTIDGHPESFKPPVPFQHIQTDFTDLGDSADDYRTSFDIRTRRGRDDYSGLIRLCQTMALPAAQLDDQIGAVMDVDQWMRYSALTVLCGIGDSFATGGLRHNIRIFVPEDGIGAAALPWDMDFVFSAGATSTMLPMTGNLRRIVDIPRYRRLYWGHVHDLVQTTFNAEYMTPWMSHYGSVVGQSFSPHASYISARGAHALSQLPPAVPFSITTNGGAPFSTAGTTATLEGSGWVDLRELRLAGSADPLEIVWLDAENWRINLPLEQGANALTLEAFDFQGGLIDTASLVVTSTSTAARPRDFLRVTELHYHPADPATPGEIAASSDDNDFEFVELRNNGSAPLPVGGVHFTAGIDVAIPENTVLAPGEFAVLVRNRAAFQARYGFGISILGEYATTALSNGGETLTLREAAGETIQSFTWDDAWFPASDGPGWSMVVRDEDTAGFVDLSTPNAWGLSFQKHGNPGAANGGIFSTEFEGWRHRHFSSTELDDISISGSDAARGGLSNLLRYALGLSPHQDPATALPTAVLAGGRIEFTYRRLANALDLAYTPESSPDFLAWTPYVDPSATVAGNGDGTESVTILFPAQLVPPHFARLRVAGSPYPD
ncbi:hypothetical protein BH23VER1_BH23VER1_29450 [soil metagenome]